LVPVGFTQSILDFRFWILDSDRSTLKAKNQFTMQCFDCEITLDLLDKSSAADRNCLPTIVRLPPPTQGKSRCQGVVLIYSASLIFGGVAVAGRVIDPLYL